MPSNINRRFAEYLPSKSVPNPAPHPLLVTLSLKQGSHKPLGTNILNPDQIVVAGVNYVESATVTSVTTVDVFQESILGIIGTPAKPLLMTLSDSHDVFRLLDNSNILNPSDSVRVDYFDSATVSGVTSVQSSESTDFLDTSGAVNGVSSVSITESADYVESATVTSLTTIDVFQESVLGIIGTPTKPLLIALERVKVHLLGLNVLNPDDSVRVSYVDSATISNVNSVQSSESTDFLDTSGAVQGTSTVSISELANYTESATVAGTTTPSLTETTDFVEATTVSGVTTPSLVDTADFIDASTVTNITSISIVEIFPSFTPQIHPLIFRLQNFLRTRIPFNYELQAIGVTYYEDATVTSTTSVSITDTADFVESQSVNGTTSVTVIETAADQEAATVAGNTSTSISETAQFVESATVSGTTSLTITETTGYVDSSTISGITTPSITDTADYVDSSTVTNITSINIIDIFPFSAYLPQPLIITLLKKGKQHFLTNSAILSPLTPASYADSATITNTTSVSIVEFTNFVDSDTVTSITIPSISDTSQFVESSTATNTTSCSITEVTPPDQATVLTTTSITSTDTAAFVDQLTITNITTPSVSEFKLSGYNDFVTVTNITTVTLVEYFDVQIFVLNGVMRKQWFSEWQVRWDANKTQRWNRDFVAP